MEISIVTDPKSLHKSTYGSITGIIFLKHIDGCFPEHNWEDFAVTILSWWVKGLLGLTGVSYPTFEGLFMDGPYAFYWTMLENNHAALTWGNRNHQTPVGEVKPSALLRSALEAAEQLIEACDVRTWQTLDTQVLKQQIAVAKTRGASYNANRAGRG